MMVLQFDVVFLFGALFKLKLVSIFFSFLIFSFSFFLSLFLFFLNFSSFSPLSLFPGTKCELTMWEVGHIPTNKSSDHLPSVPLTLFTAEV